MRVMVCHWFLILPVDRVSGYAAEGRSFKPSYSATANRVRPSGVLKRPSV